MLPEWSVSFRRPRGPGRATLAVAALERGSVGPNKLAYLARSPRQAQPWADAVGRPLSPRATASVGASQSRSCRSGRWSRSAQRRALIEQTTRRSGRGVRKRPRLSWSLHPLPKGPLPTPQRLPLQERPVENREGVHATRSNRRPPDRSHLSHPSLHRFPPPQVTVSDHYAAACGRSLGQPRPRAQASPSP